MLNKTKFDDPIALWDWLNSLPSDTVFDINHTLICLLASWAKECRENSFYNVTCFDNFVSVAGQNFIFSDWMKEFSSSLIRIGRGNSLGWSEFENIDHHPVTIREALIILDDLDP